MVRKATEIEVEVLEYLNELRDSGATNRCGSGEYVMDEFDLDKKESRRLVALWMSNFNHEGNYEILEKY